MSRETWYVMEDGSCGDPRDMVSDEKGILSHKDGRKVAYSPHGPRSRGVDADVERAKEPSANPVADAPAEQPKRRYKTRESKAE